MSGISTGTGLFSGIDFVSLVDSLISVQRRPAARMEVRIAELQAEQAGIAQYEANILALNAAITGLGSDSTFEALSTSNSDASQLTVSASSSATPGTYELQSLKLASQHELLSRGYANSDTQTVGAGTLTIARGGELRSDIELDLLNGGSGVGRGTIEITDRSGASAEIDLTEAYTLNDVLDAINNEAGIDVTASTADGQLVLTDSSGGGGSLIVADVGTGSAATELGIAGSIAGDVLTGTDLNSLSEDSLLSQLDDGLGIRRFDGAPDLIINLTDASTLEVNLDDAVSIGDVLSAINDHEDNNGKLTASFANGQITLTDNAAGGNAFSIEDNSGAAVLRGLGLEGAAVGNVITGDDLRSDLNTVSLKNLNGGAGITQLGSISLTDRDGNTASVDLSAANSIQDVLRAINSAEDGGTPLGLTATLDENGTGIRVVDTTGGSASNLIIADLGGSTIAADLGLTIDAAETSIDTGSLGLRQVSEATLLTDYSAFERGIDEGQIQITDSNGDVAVVSISSAAKTIGDVIDRINAAAGIAVEARLNSTGDGFEIVDLAGGAGTLSIEDVEGTAGADLKITGDAVGGAITSSNAISVTTDADDTLDDLVAALGEATDRVNATLFDTGASVNPLRLRLQSAKSGTANKLIIEDNGLDLGLTTQTEASDALLRLGGNPNSAFLINSDTNSFKGVAGGIDVTLQAVGENTSTVSISNNNGPITSALSSLVTAYNSLISAGDNLTRFDAESNERGVLQGKSIVSRVESRLDELFTRRLNNTSGQVIRSLFDVGITVGEGGKLSLDSSRLNDVLAENPDAIKEFFTNDETGFGDVASGVFESITDGTEGLLAIENGSIDNTLSALNGRVSELDDILDIRRQRLLQQFVLMEETLASLDIQQKALGSLSAISPTK